MLFLSIKIERHRLVKTRLFELILSVLLYYILELLKLMSHKESRIQFYGISDLI